MEEKDQKLGLGAPSARTAYPVDGMCICGHNEPAHTIIDHEMARKFVGQKWNGCTQCTCFFFRQEDEISVGLRDGTLRIVFPD